MTEVEVQAPTLTPKNIQSLHEGIIVGGGKTFTSSFNVYSEARARICKHFN
jgi:hypothetical protein